jgi:hypothetical protein
MNQGRGVSNWWSSQWTPRKKSPLKTVYKNEASETASSAHEYDQKKIDGILDKISRSGYETLTKEEKDYLFKAGKN